MITELYSTTAVAVIVLPLFVALIVSFLSTPIVKTFACKVGAIDVPTDGRRMHTIPIPRMGGLAIFLGFIISVLLFSEVDDQMKGILLGAVIITIMGIIDDITPLRASLKLIVQIIAALIPIYYGVQITCISNPNIFSDNLYWNFGWLSIPITVLWIVGLTNAVNLIDGLDGLAIGVSAIGAMTMLVIAILVSEPQIAVIMAALVGACIGFMPYNMNPAKIFMGDTGSTFLGYILACISIQGLFKFYVGISFIVPFLILGLPIFDTAFAILRRLAHGQNPMSPDRSHVHHRLIDMGLNQKQAVAVLYVISAILGLSAVMVATNGELKALVCLVAMLVIGVMAGRVVILPHLKAEEREHTSDTADEASAVPTPASAETPQTTDTAEKESE